MEQSAKTEAYAESLDLERFVRGLRRLIGMPEIDINNILTKQKGRAATKATADIAGSQRRK